MHHAVVLAHVAGGVDAGHRALQPRGARDPARLAQLQPGAPRDHHVGHHPCADHHAVAVQLEPALRDHAAHSPVGALEALELVATVDLDRRARSSTRWKKPPTSAPNARSRVTSSCMTIEHWRRTRRPARRPPRSRCSCRRSSPRARPRPRPPGSRRNCRTRAGSGCRRGPTRPTRSRRTLAPVASSALSKRTSSLVDSLATRSPASSFITLVRSEQLDVVLVPPAVRAAPGRPRALSRPQVALGERRPVIRRRRPRGPRRRIVPSAPSSRSAARAVGGGEAAADEKVVDVAVAATADVGAGRRRDAPRSAR